MRAPMEEQWRVSCWPKSFQAWSRNTFVHVYILRCLFRRRWNPGASGETWLPGERKKRFGWRFSQKEKDEKQVPSGWNPRLQFLCFAFINSLLCLTCSPDLSEALLPMQPSDVLDMPVDPNEPTYCLCHQVSYGEMIGCDNPDVGAR